MKTSVLPPNPSITFKIRLDTKKEFWKFCRECQVTPSFLLQNILYYGMQDKKKFREAFMGYVNKGGLKGIWTN
jgi:hypothetical protein